MSSRTELWEAVKGGPLDGHVGFTVADDEHVRLPYAMLATILQHAGMRRKLSTDHGSRISIRHAERPTPGEPPAGYRWMHPRECHGSDQFCDRCAPESPERRVTSISR